MDDKYGSARSIASSTEKAKKIKFVAATNQQHSTSSYHGNNAKEEEAKKIKGRKSIRAIAEDLNKRIRLVKADQIEWDALEAKICKTKKYLF